MNIGVHASFEKDADSARFVRPLDRSLEEPLGAVAGGWVRSEEARIFA